MSETTVPVWQHHSICSFTRQDGESAIGCICQVTSSGVDIVEGKISHLGEKDDGCPHK